LTFILFSVQIINSCINESDSVFPYIMGFRHLDYGIRFPLNKLTLNATAGCNNAELYFRIKSLVHDSDVEHAA
jgi:hypothetical protein